MAPKSTPTCSHHPYQLENSTNLCHLRSSRTCTSYIISFGGQNLYYRRPRGKVGNKSRNVREISHTLRLFRGTFRLFRKCYHGKYEFYTPNEKAYQMKSGSKACTHTIESLLTPNYTTKQISQRPRAGASRGGASWVYCSGAGTAAATGGLHGDMRCDACK